MKLVFLKQVFYETCLENEMVSLKIECKEKPTALASSGSDFEVEVYGVIPNFLRYLLVGWKPLSERCQAKGGMVLS